MLNISCLHPAREDIAAFEAARRALGLDDVMLKHRVRSDLAAAGDGGSLPPAAARHAAAELFSLAKGADGLLVTTSGLGSIAEASAMLGIPIIEADRALAAAAASEGGRVIALCDAGSALAATRALFETAAVATGATVEVRLVASASAHFAEGRLPDYLQAVAAAAELAFEDGAATVALVRTPMAAAARQLKARRVLTVPAASLAAAVAAVRATTGKSS